MKGKNTKAERNPCPRSASALSLESSASFFPAPETREILNDLLEKYADDGELQFTLPDVPKVAPIWRHGNMAEIVRKFGGADNLCNAVNQLQSLLYAA